MANKKSSMLSAGVVCLAVFFAVVGVQGQTVQSDDASSGTGTDTSVSSADPGDTSTPPSSGENKFFRKKHKETKKTADKNDNAPAGEKKSFFAKIFGIFSKKKKDVSPTQISAQGQSAQPGESASETGAEAVSPVTGVAVEETVQPSESSTSSGGKKLFRKKRSPRDISSQDTPPADASVSQTANGDDLFKVKVAMHNKSAKQIKDIIDRYVRDAKDYYVEGDIENSQKNINKALQLDPQNAEAMRFRSKISLIKEKMLEAKRDFSEQCYFEGAFYLEKGDPLDGLLLITKAVRLNPQSEKARTLLATIQGMNRNMINSMGKKDGRSLEKAIKYFLNEKYEKASVVFRKLQLYYPDTVNFLGFTLAHCADEANIKRSQEYVDEAVVDIRHERYLKAKEDLSLAFEMDRENMDARVIFEQVKIELNLSAQSSSDIFNPSAQVPEQLQ